MTEDALIQQDDYALEQSDYDMTMRLHKGGQEIARVSYQGMARCQHPGDTKEMAFARALSFRRAGMVAISG